MNAKDKKFDMLIQLAMVGDQHVGKTQLINRYVNENFTSMVTGISFGVDFEVKVIQLGGKHIKLQIFCMASLEGRCRTINNAYYRGCQGFIVVYDVTNRNSFTQIGNWLADIQNHCNNSKASKILIGNKCDLTERRVVSTEEGAELAKKHNIRFFETSAKENQNVEDLFMTLTEDCSGLKSSKAKIIEKRGSFIEAWQVSLGLTSGGTRKIVEEDEKRKKKTTEEEKLKRKYIDEEERKKKAAAYEEGEIKAAEVGKRKKKTTDEEKIIEEEEEEGEEKKKVAECEERKRLNDLILEIEKMIDLQTSGTMSSSDGLLVDKKYKLTTQEAAENDYIASDPSLLSFNNSMQQSWNQSFVAASVIGTSQLSLESKSKTVLSLNVLSHISSSLPFASIVFTGASSLVNSINSAHKEVEFRNLAALVPSSDAVEMGILSSAIARHFTLSYDCEIKNSVYTKKSSKRFTKVKEMFMKTFDAIDSKLARSFTCKDGLDWLAADISRICMSYIFNCNVLELSQLVAEVTRDRNAFARRLVDLVKDTYPISKPTVVSTSQSSSGSTTTSSEGVYGQGDSNTKFADSDEVLKLKEASRKQEEAIKKNEEEVKRLRKVAEGTKSVVDAFIDTTGIGASGQVQAAMRTTDGKKVKVVVDNPVVNETLAAIAQVTENSENKLNDHSEKISRLEEMFRQQISNSSSNSNRGCCVTS